MTTLEYPLIAEGRRDLRTLHTATDSEAAIEAEVDRTHVTLLALLERGEGVAWQEVIGAPADLVWEAAAGSLEDFLRHLPSSRKERIGRVVSHVPGTLLCASDLDATHPGSGSTHPAIFSITVTTHPTQRDASTVHLSAASIGANDPSLMLALGHICSRIRSGVTERRARGRRETAVREGRSALASLVTWLAVAGIFR